MMCGLPPCNPSGSVYSREVTALAKVENIQIKSFIVEIWHINFRNFCSIASIPGMLEKTVTVNALQSICNEDGELVILEVQNSPY
jgi:aspartate aminotransferase